MIAFRTDANKYTATGHAMRCMSIADAVIGQGGEVVFIVADGDSRDFILLRGYRTEVLDSDWKIMEDELPKLFRLLDKLNPSWLVISGYQTTDGYLSMVSSRVKTMYIDDLNDRIYPVSAIVNYNIYAGQMDYQGMYQDKNTNLYLGPKYTPLRKQFKNVGMRDKFDGKSLLVLVGGTDNFKMAQHIINMADTQEFCDTWTFHIVSGYFGGVVHVPRRMDGRVFIHKNVTEMAALMTQCMMAVTAGGSTCYELCACGLPSVSYSLSDDQLPGVNKFDQAGIIPYCGDIRNDMGKTIHNIFHRLNVLMENRDMYFSYSEKMKKIVDGQGSDRIAAILDGSKRGMI